jgi:hypothetical protein
MRSIGRSWGRSILAPSADRGEVWGVWEATEAIHRRVFAGETVTLEDHPWTLLRNGGPEEAFFTSYFTPIHDETGAVVANLATAFETTNAVKEKAERDRAERALRKSEAMLQAAIDFARLAAMPGIHNPTSCNGMIRSGPCGVCRRARSSTTSCGGPAFIQTILRVSRPLSSGAPTRGAMGSTISSTG